MKILLTGEPRSGKTTILEEFIDEVENKQGFVTREVRENGERIGFEIVSSSGKTLMFANINSDSQVRVSRYGIEVQNLDKFVNDLPNVKQGNLLYIDEIGQMQLFSKSFKSLVNHWLSLKNTYVGTISSVYHDDFTERILRLDDVVLLTVSLDNREQIRAILKNLVINIALFNGLKSVLQDGITKMAQYYAEENKYIQLNKLFKNAILYLAENKVEEVGAGLYRVNGINDLHNVEETDNGLQCDCNLFNGKGEFKNNPGECSHIQAIKLSRLLKHSKNLTN